MSELKRSPKLFHTKPFPRRVILKEYKDCHHHTYERRFNSKFIREAIKDYEEYRCACCTKYFKANAPVKIGLYKYQVFGNIHEESWLCNQCANKPEICIYSLSYIISSTLSPSSRSMSSNAKLIIILARE